MHADAVMAVAIKYRSITEIAAMAVTNHFTVRFQPFNDGPIRHFMWCIVNIQVGQEAI